MDELAKVANKLKKIKPIKNKFPNEALPKKGYILEYVIDKSKAIFKRINGNIFKPEWYNYVITKEGKFIMGWKHHFLGNAEDVLAAGSVRFKNGRIVEINNLSGHYKPTVKESLNFVSLFETIKLPIKRANFKIYEFIEKGNGYLDPKLVKTIEVKTFKSIK